MNLMLGRMVDGMGYHDEMEVWDSQDRKLFPNTVLAWRDGSSRSSHHRRTTYFDDWYKIALYLFCRINIYTCSPLRARSISVRVSLDRARSCVVIVSC